MGLRGPSDSPYRQVICVRVLKLVHPSAAYAASCRVGPRSPSSPEERGFCADGLDRARSLSRPSRDASDRSFD